MIFETDKKLIHGLFFFTFEKQFSALLFFSDCMLTNKNALFDFE